MKLSELKKGIQALIVKVGGASWSNDRVRRFLEMGLLEGSQIEILHEAPFGKDPLAVRVRGGVIAMRRSEASGVEVLVCE